MSVGDTNPSESATFTRQELDKVKFVLSDTKRKEIIKELLRTNRYFNDMCTAIGGSKTTVADALMDLVNEGIVDVDWEIVEREAPANPARYRAVKMFRIRRDYRATFERLNL